MARLKAHGTELLRLRREFFIESEKPTLPSQIGTLVAEWRPTKTKHFEELSYRSDGKILRKSGYWQTDLPYQSDHWYDWGWKLYKKLRKDVDPVEHANRLRQVITNHLAERDTDWRIA
jgi:hypothetical protein